MINLPILIPASQKKTADGHSLMPLSLRDEERLWGNWTPAHPPLRIDTIFMVGGHDVRKEERDIKTGKWRPRNVPFAERTDQIKNEPMRAGAHPGFPLREVRPPEYSRLGISKHLGEPKTNLLIALNSLQAALRKRKVVDIKEAAIAVISTGYAASAASRLLDERARQSRLHRLNPISPAARQELDHQFAEKEKGLSDRLTISKWVEQLSEGHLQILATNYIGEVLFPGKVIFWATATSPLQISPGIFFPDLKAAIAAAVVLDDQLRRCLKCGRIFSVSRYDGVCCNLRCSNALRQFRHSSKARKKA